ncbi:methyltransferase domain-containing protein [Desulfospira joergensenii]|uniref:methyltransferase domain-containing protein n=1 Tax=Desulfospira joergensenii TaxID=53329 RepID=UPI000422C2FC|nr:methyltransferase domain-containing protein [Desulfospira joergensenii]
MKPLSSSDRVDLFIDISWEQDGIKHQERYFADGLNCWRDVFPGSPMESLLKNKNAPSLSVEIKPGELVPAHDPNKVLFIPWSRLNRAEPDLFRPGRFYPQGLISGQPGIFRENRNPFRCVEKDSKGIRADLNHPMAKIPLTLNMEVLSRSSKLEERGGACTDWMELALSGPGMQARCSGIPTDFFSGNSLDRRNPDPDPDFYRIHRFVPHIDARASRNLSEIYAELLCPGARVLDLMAGWESHLPRDLDLSSVHGIGLNKNELESNPCLSSHHLQDLNENRDLDFEDQTFDAVICSLSVEYLVHPFPIFKEAARILKPGGVFAVTFSNRWFPEKAVRIWEDLHDFERMGMVKEYFLGSGKYESVSTQSRRGCPRPYQDRYYPRMRLSDPVYAVIGKTPGG